MQCANAQIHSSTSYSLRFALFVGILDICRGHRGHCPWRIFLSCGEILDVEKFLHVEKLYMWVICLISWADMPELLALLGQVKLIDHIIHTVLLWDICLMEYTLFCQKSILLRYTLFSRETCFVAIYALSVWREIMPKMLSVEKKWQISCMSGTWWKSNWWR